MKRLIVCFKRCKPYTSRPKREVTKKREQVDCAQHHCKNTCDCKSSYYSTVLSCERAAPFAIDDCSVKRAESYGLHAGYSLTGKELHSKYCAEQNRSSHAPVRERS